MRVFAVVALLLACYDPVIHSRDFSCGPSNACPRGFSCMSGLCFRNGESSGSFVGTGAATPSDMVASLPSGSRVLASPRTGELVATDPTGAPLFTVVAAGSGPPTVTAVAQTNGPLVVIWNFKSFKLPSGVTLTTLDGSVAAGIAASGTLEIAGTIDWRGKGGLGGFPAASPAPDPSYGAAVSAQPGSSANGSGGGGGGYGDVGGSGLDSSGAPTGGAGGGAFGDSGMRVLFQGAGGGGGGDSTNMSKGGAGGGGGGALALFAAEIDLSGSILVDGLDGEGTTVPSSGGGGGGAGGSILLSGSVVNLQAAYRLSALGGKGGSGPGGVGGAGGPGRIWIGGKLSDLNPAQSMPSYNNEVTPLVAFPRAP